MARVSHMVLPVSDILKSRDWYVNRLGFALERVREEAVGIKDQSGLTIERPAQPCIACGRPNQRWSRLAPKCAFSATSASDGA